MRGNGAVKPPVRIENVSCPNATSMHPQPRCHRPAAEQKRPDETGPSGLRSSTDSLNAHAALGMGVVFDSGETRCRPLLRLLLMT